MIFSKTVISDLTFSRLAQFLESGDTEILSIVCFNAVNVSLSSFISYFVLVTPAVVYIHIEKRANHEKN
jgi:hypothetical protein